MRTTGKGFIVWDQTTDPFSHSQLAANWDLADSLIGGVPLKTILAYHADIQNETIPNTYAVCDGTVLNSSQQDINPGSSYTLPDLRNRFLLGGDPTKAAGAVGTTSDAPTSAPGPKGVGGIHSKALITAELPAHTHTGSAASAGAHTHGGSATTAAGGTHGHTGSVTSAGLHDHAGSTTNTTGAHTHSGSTAVSGGLHGHTVNDPGHFHPLFNRISPNSGSPDATVLRTGGDHDTTSATNANSASTGVTINNGGAHTHTLTIVSDGAHSHSFSVASDGLHSHALTIDNTSGSHTHTVTITSDGAHTHSLTVDATGGNTAFDTRPRYYGVIYIMKVKN